MSPHRHLIAACLLLVSCDTRPAGEQASQALSALDRTEREIRADWVRQVAECRAVAIEDPAGLETCQRTLRAAQEVNARLLRDIAARRDEISGYVSTDPQAGRTE